MRFYRRPQPSPPPTITFNTVEVNFGNDLRQYISLHFQKYRKFVIAVVVALHFISFHFLSFTNCPFVDLTLVLHSHTHTHTSTSVRTSIHPSKFIAIIFSFVFPLDFIFISFHFILVALCCYCV